MKIMILKRNFASFLTNLLLILVCFSSLSFAQSDNPHFKRGKDWMDLKHYEKARAELIQAIEEEPKNVEARYLIAESYYHENKLIHALAWAYETVSIDPTHDQAEALLTKIREKGAELGAAEFLSGCAAEFLSGCVTLDKAKEIGMEAAEEAVVLRLTPICVLQFIQDPAKDQKLKDLKATDSWKRGDFVAYQGWATMPGEGHPDSKVANACAKLLIVMNP